MLSDEAKRSVYDTQELSRRFRDAKSSWVPFSDSDSEPEGDAESEGDAKSEGKVESEGEVEPEAAARDHPEELGGWVAHDHVSIH